MGQRQAVTKAIATRYRRAGRAEKTKILDELCAMTGGHRNHARKALGQAFGPRVVGVRRPRAPTYFRSTREPAWWSSCEQTREGGWRSTGEYVKCWPASWPDPSARRRGRGVSRCTRAANPTPDTVFGRSPCSCARPAPEHEPQAAGWG